MGKSRFPARKSTKPQVLYTQADVERMLEKQNLVSRKKGFDLGAQLAMDGCLIAANELFHAGPKRAGAFFDRAQAVIQEIANEVIDCDDSGDEELSVAVRHMDGRLKEILGERFTPFLDRYFGEEL